MAVDAREEDASWSACFGRKEKMRNYEICYRKADGRLALKYEIGCTDDIHAKIVAHALMSREYKGFEVWHDDELVYRRPEAAH